MKKLMRLPRNLHVFAHTNPLYCLKDKKPVFERASAGYLLTYIKSSRRWVENYSDFAIETEKKEAMDLLESAEKSILDLWTW